jgi:hypothetical protein
MTRCLPPCGPAPAATCSRGQQELVAGDPAGRPRRGHLQPSVASRVLATSPAASRPWPSRSRADRTGAGGPGADRQGPQQRRHRPSGCSLPQRRSATWPPASLPSSRSPTAPRRCAAPSTKASANSSVPHRRQQGSPSFTTTPSAQSTPTLDAHPEPHLPPQHPPTYGLAITLEPHRPALRSTRNSSEESSAPRRGLAGGATEQLAGRAGGSLALAGGPPPSRHGCQAPQALSTGTGGVTQRARWAWWPRRCGGRPCLRQRVGVLGQRPEFSVWCGCPASRVPVHAPLSGVRCGRLSVQMSGVQRGCPVSVGSRVHCVRPGGCGGVAVGRQPHGWDGRRRRGRLPCPRPVRRLPGSEPGGRGWRRSAGPAEGSAWTWPSS